MPRAVSFTIGSKYKEFKRDFVDIDLNKYLKNMVINHEMTVQEMGENNIAPVYQVVGFDPLNMFTYLDGQPEPMRSLPKGGRVKLCATFKRAIPLFATFFSEQNWLGKLVMIPSLIKYASFYLDFAEFALRYDLSKPECYSQPVREIYRCIELADGKSPIKNVFSFFLEYDTAYRYRAQDILVEARIEEFKFRFLSFRSIREIRRLFGIMIEREISIKSKWIMISKLLIPYLFVSRKALNKVRTFFLNLSKDEIKLSKEDIYWTNRIYSDYNFRGLSWEDRKIENIKKYGVV